MVDTQPTREGSEIVDFRIFRDLPREDPPHGDQGRCMRANDDAPNSLGVTLGDHSTQGSGRPCIELDQAFSFSFRNDKRLVRLVQAWKHPFQFGDRSRQRMIERGRAEPLTQAMLCTYRMIHIGLPFTLLASQLYEGVDSLQASVVRTGVDLLDRL